MGIPEPSAVHCRTDLVLRALENRWQQVFRDIVRPTRLHHHQIPACLHPMGFPGQNSEAIGLRHIEAYCQTACLTDRGGSRCCSQIHPDAFVIIACGRHAGSSSLVHSRLLTSLGACLCGLTCFSWPEAWVIGVPGMFEHDWNCGITGFAAFGKTPLPRCGLREDPWEQGRFQGPTLWKDQIWR